MTTTNIQSDLMCKRASEPLSLLDHDLICRHDRDLLESFHKSTRGSQIDFCGYLYAYFL